MLFIELFSSCRKHHEEILKKLLIPFKMEPNTAARKCPACRKNVENKDDAIYHSERCIELIRAQQKWIDGQQMEHQPPTPHSNGTVSHEISEESSEEGTESRPSCSVCGKVFKVRLEFGETNH